MAALPSFLQFDSPSNVKNEKTQDDTDVTGWLKFENEPLPGLGLTDQFPFSESEPTSNTSTSFSTCYPSFGSNTTTQPLATAVSMTNESSQPMSSASRSLPPYSQSEQRVPLSQYSNSFPPQYNAGSYFANSTGVDQANMALFGQYPLPDFSSFYSGAPIQPHQLSPPQFYTLFAHFHQLLKNQGDLFVEDKKRKAAPRPFTRRVRQTRPKVVEAKGAVQCKGRNRKKGTQCRNAALMEYIGPRPIYCAEHIELDPNSLYEKCKSTYQKDPGDNKGCKEVVLKEFGVCYKHYSDVVKEMVKNNESEQVRKHQVRITELLTQLEQEAAAAKKKDGDLYQRKNKLIPKFQEMKKQITMAMEALGNPVSLEKQKNAGESTYLGNHEVCGLLYHDKSFDEEFISDSDVSPAQTSPELSDEEDHIVINEGNSGLSLPDPFCQDLLPQHGFILA